MIKGMFIKSEDNTKLSGWANKDKKKKTQQARTVSQIELDKI